MDVYTTEQEQVEMLRKWFKEYGPTILVGAVLGLAAIYGWRYWQGLKAQKQEAASTAYEQVVKQLADKTQHDAGIAAGEKLVSEQPGSVYANLTSLYLAKAAVIENKLDDAVKYLRAVVDKPVQPALGVIARARLARVLIAQDKAQEALALLDAEKNPGEFRAGLEEVRGDAYKALGKLVEARAAYQAAQAAKGAGKTSPLLSMKLDSVDAGTLAAAGAAK